MRWLCTICGYVYDPARGDLKNRVSPGTAFEELPSDWLCPVCGCDQTNFVEQSTKER